MFERAAAAQSQARRACARMAALRATARSAATVLPLPANTKRLRFRWWTDTNSDAQLAFQLWGDPRVNCSLGASLRGARRAQTDARLATELMHAAERHVQYWPVFKCDGEPSETSFVGVVGLRVHNDEQIELGFHIRPECWRQGYATEAARAVLDHAFGAMRFTRVQAGHGPENAPSQRTIEKLGFRYTHIDLFEGEPDLTYELRNTAWHSARSHGTAC